MPEFEEFLDKLSVAVMSNKFYYDLFLRTGLSNQRLPKTELGLTDFLTEFMKHPSFEVAQEHAKNILEVVKEGVEYSSLPRTELTLLQTYNDFKNRNYYYTAGSKIMIAAQISLKEATDQIKNIDELFANEVVSGEIKNLYDVYIRQHNILVEQGAVYTTIKDFPMLSKMIGGFNQSRIGLIMGETGFGKTNFSLSLALSARKTMNTAYVNLEMDFLDVMRRAMIIESGDTYENFYKNPFPIDQVINNYPTTIKNLHVTDGKTITLKQIKYWLRSKHKETPLSFVIIDYDQKIEMDFNSREPEWKSMQKALVELEDLAKELKIFIFVIAQMNREGSISSSHRAQFPAHTILKFVDHEEHGPIIEVVKNRHGKKGLGLKVNYSEKNSKIEEVEIINLYKKKEQPKTLSKQTQASYNPSNY